MYLEYKSRVTRLEGGCRDQDVALLPGNFSYFLEVDHVFSHYFCSFLVTVTLSHLQKSFPYAKS